MSFISLMRQNLFFSYLYAKEWLDTRPIQFERYKDSDQFDADLIKKFPLGSDIREMMKLFEQSGARCKDRSDEEDISNDIKKYDIIYWCKYNSGWFSLPPFQVYEIWFMGDKNYQLVHISGSTYIGFVI